jgi:hypothetical protein
VCGQFHDDNSDECPNYYLNDFKEITEKLRPLFEFPPLLQNNNKK